MTFQSKITTNITLNIDRLLRSFVWSMRPFPHPLWPLHVAFNIIHINPHLISCYDVLKSFYYHLHWQADPDCFQHGSLSVVNQKTRHEFCTVATHLNFPVKIWWQDPMLMPTSSATSRTVKWRFPRITARNPSTWSSFVDVECRPGLWFSPSHILPTLKGLKLIALHSAHRVLPAYLVKQIKYLCKIFA